MIMHHYLNIGFIERALRTTLGIFLLIFAFNSPIEAQWLARLMISSVYTLITALTSWDPIYAIVEIIRTRTDHYHFLHP